MKIQIDEIQNIPDQYFPKKLSKYIELIQLSERFPPIEVKKATKGYWLLDGAHRLKANVICGKIMIDAIIKE